MEHEFPPRLEPWKVGDPIRFNWDNFYNESILCDVDGQFCDMDEKIEQYILPGFSQIKHEMSICDSVHPEYNEYLPEIKLPLTPEEVTNWVYSQSDTELEETPDEHILRFDAYDPNDPVNRRIGIAALSICDNWIMGLQCGDRFVVSYGDSHHAINTEKYSLGKSDGSWGHVLDVRGIYDAPSLVRRFNALIQESLRWYAEEHTDSE